MRTLIRLTLCLAATLLAPPVHAQESAPAEIRAALRNWRARYGDDWQLVYNELTQHGRMLFGSGLTPPFVPRNDGQWDLLARHLLVQAEALLGVEQETLTTDAVIPLPLAQVGTTDKLAVRLRQAIQGVPVLGGWVDVVFEHETGTLLAIDSQALPLASDMDVHATISADAARALAQQTFRLETGASSASQPPRLVLDARDLHVLGRAALVWEVTFAGQGLDGRDLAVTYLVAAQGVPRVLARTDRIHEAAPQDPHEGRTRVVANVTRDGCCFAPDDGTNHVRMPMVNLTVRFADGSEALTDEDGFFSTPRAHTASRANSAAALAFEGPFVAVHNHLYWPEGDLLLETPTHARVITMNPAPLERDTAQANAFYRASQTRTWIRRVNPLDTVMDSAADAPGVPFKFVVNWVIPFSGTQRGTAPCNAIYDANAGVIKLSVSGAAFDRSCPNASFAPVLWHELGHWLNERYMNSNGRRGFAEGNADAFALYQMDQPDLTYGQITRSGDNRVPFCGDCASRQDCHGEAHTDGLPLMGALWKARRNLEASLGPELGAAYADALFLGWMNAFEQDEIHSIIEWQWLVLDDDDHDLANGTPNVPALDRAFRAQGFPGFVLPVTTVICP